MTDTEDYNELLSIVADIVDAGHMDQEGLARLRAHLGYKPAAAIAQDRAARAQAEPVADNELLDFADPKVQMVYDFLCADLAPPAGEHWEGWVARRIVTALTTTAPAARAQGAGEAVASSQDAEMLHGAHEVIRIWNERARKFGFDGVAGMLNAFRHGEAGSTTPTTPQAPPVQGDQPIPAGFWLAPREPDDHMVISAGGFPYECAHNDKLLLHYRNMRDSWLARQDAAPQPLAASEAKDTPQ